METILAPESFSLQVNVETKEIKKSDKISTNRCGLIERNLVWIAIKLRIFYFACKELRQFSRILVTYRSLIRLRKDTWNGDLNKLYKIDGKYYFNLYTPGWPSKVYDNICKSELRRHAPNNILPEKTFFAFLAITRKCPMRCEHCFEWDNLNQKESFTKHDLFKVLDIYQNEGVQQFHFSGGEPMTRFKDLLELFKYTKGKSECWVVTSGFNCTNENAKLLKQAGCKGIVVSIDHYIPELHNIFRGHTEAFNHATNAVRAAKQAGLVTAVSVCATKIFIDGGHLMPYLEFAKKMGAHFVQVLEPKSVGHYNGANVLLQEKHIKILEDAFKRVNHSKEYSEYPILMYHGYHQRRVGCFAGSRSVYIDSAGDVHACPFCHTSSFNILDLIKKGDINIPKKENSCPQFNKIA
jgi:MoaA/NifB/PqqE/SkfB family radical SAM enzyme